VVQAVVQDGAVLLGLATLQVHHQVKVIMVGLLQAVFTAVLVVVVELLPLVALLLETLLLVALVALAHLHLSLAQL
jgi:hypothetical protein